MAGLIEVHPSLLGVQGAVAAGLERVRERFDRQLRSDLPPVARLCGHIERYRGKMLRPVLVLACGMAASEEDAFGDDHVTVAAVCEMIHMATLVHDDVLDEAETRRRGETVNSLHGNEAAVILGDYLIASAYHLCSQLDSQRTALLLGHVSMTMCAGELLQLSHRGDFSLDEPTYFEIIERKTAALVALACRLGAACSGADEALCRRFERFGSRLGVAFQIQDDLLDLGGAASALGKPVGQDLGKGKLTLPLIHHLATAPALERGRSLRLIERACLEGEGPDARDAAAALGATLREGGSVEYAAGVARSLVDQARAELAPLRESPPKRFLAAMADAVVTRTF
jgi:octaprenyl-diphosphate synthase